MKKVLIFVVGILVGGILFGTTLTFASSGQKNVKVTYSGIKIVVDGQLIETSEQPFLLKSRVYVPLRAVADALQKEVGWENSTVLIGEEKQSLLLTHLINPSLSGVTIGEKLMSIDGNDVRGFYVKGGKMRSEGTIKFFVQNKGIKEVKGSIALDDSNPMDIKPVQAEIKKDDTVVWSGTIERGANPVPVSIKLEDSSNLIIKLSSLDETKVDFIDFVARY